MALRSKASYVITSRRVPPSKALRVSKRNKSIIAGIKNEGVRKIMFDDNSQEISSANSLDTYNSVLDDNAKAIKLELLLLGYMFEKDDGKISFFENRAIKKHFSSKKKVIFTKDKRELGELKVVGSNLIQLNDFRIENNYTELQVSEAIDFLKKITNNKKRYRNIINSIDTCFSDS